MAKSHRKPSAIAPRAAWEADRAGEGKHVAGDGAAGAGDAALVGGVMGVKGLAAGPAPVLSVFVLLLAGCGCGRGPLPTVPSVDLERYQGLWYEIGRYPNRFEKGCVAATARYSLRDDGAIRVVNRCRKGSLDGPPAEAIGKAWVVEPETNAKLKVRFFWPFTGDYWILDLAEDYSWAVVGEPCRRYLWILARSPGLEPETLQPILARLPPLGYNPARLEFPPQKEQPELR